MRKLCPLSLVSPGNPLTKCLQDSCAWWAELLEECAVLAMARPDEKITTLPKGGE